MKLLHLTKNRSIILDALQFISLDDLTSVIKDDDKPKFKISFHLRDLYVSEEFRTKEEAQKVYDRLIDELKHA